MVFTRKQQSINVFSKIWNLVDKKIRTSIIFLIFLMTVGMCLEMLSLAMVIPILGLLNNPSLETNITIVNNILSSLSNPKGNDLILLGFLSLLIIYFLKTIFFIFQSWKQTYFATEMTARLSQRLYWVYQNQPWTFFYERNSAQLIQNVLGEVNHLMHGLILPAMILITEILILFGICFLVIYIEPKISITMLISMFCIFSIFYYSLRKPLLRWGEKRQYHDRFRMQNLQQGLGGIKNVKIYNKEEAFSKFYYSDNFSSARFSRYLAFFSLIPRYLFEFLAILVISLIVFYLLSDKSYSDTIIPKVGFFAAVGFRILPSINRINTALQSVRFMYPVVDLLNREINLEIERSPALKEVKSKNWNSIKIENIYFDYVNSAQTILEDINIIINKGDNIGIIGESGSGKTTLIDIILGLLKPNSGCIYLDGESIYDNIKNWQSHIGYVTQEVFLMDLSLKKNIAFGIDEDDIDEEKVNEVIIKANLSNFVATLSDGIETIVGERGARISGGQKQRIGIARALYREPSIIILDEATSALDQKNEKEVLEAIKSLKGKVTIIIISHDISTLKFCNKILKIEDKTIHVTMEYDGLINE